MHLQTMQSTSVNNCSEKPKWVLNFQEKMIMNNNNHVILILPQDLTFLGHYYYSMCLWHNLNAISQTSACMFVCVRAVCHGALQL